MEFIRTFPTPTNATKIWNSVGGKFLQQFLKGFGNITFTVTKMINKGVLFTWGEEQEKSFQALKSMLSLYYPTFIRHLKVSVMLSVLV